jgi:membrane protein YdbS with pleckstrin-like domain
VNDVADGVERQLDRRWIGTRRFAGWIGALLLAPPTVIPAVLVAALAPVPGWAQALLIGGSIAVLALLAWSAHFWPPIAYRHSAYRVDDLGLEVRRGVVWRRRISVPRSRVQHTDVSQGPLERGRGLGTLSVFTAGTEYARVDLPGLDHATALRIRDHLLPRSIRAGEAGDAV